MDLKQKAQNLLKEFKGDDYLFGMNVLGKMGPLLGDLDANQLVVVSGTSLASQKCLDALKLEARKINVNIVKVIKGAGSNAPRADVRRIATELQKTPYNGIVAIGGGSNIDAVKCAECLKVLEVDFEPLFGTGQVTALLQKSGKKLAKMLAIQTAASSSAHLTKYSNITDPSTGQKKLIIDPSIVPVKAIFDYNLIQYMSSEYLADGAFDGIGHCLEVLYGSVRQPFYSKVKEIAITGIELIVKNLNKAIQNPNLLSAREEIGLGTDLGGYAIMVGGTNGGHLTSFSLVEVMSHGRAVGLMNPYYTVLFANAIREPAELVHAILQQYGYVKSGDIKNLSNRELAIEVGRGLQELSKATGFPIKLVDVPGFNKKDYVARALAAAKDPALKSKLENMPTPMSIDQVDEYMGSVLDAAVKGDLLKVKTL